MSTGTASLKARPIASSNYVSNWGAWEACRELVCNAIDADPDRYIVDYRGKDTLTVYTTTAPTFHECCVVGEGSKDSQTGTIGQFGEGLKLAALTAIRKGGSFSIRTPTFSATYETRTEPGARHPILWIKPRAISPENSKPGCLITLTLPDADFPSFRDNFLRRDAGVRVTRRTDDTGCRIYNKGILITTLRDVPSIYHYNFKALAINRDRSAVNSGTLYGAYMNYLAFENGIDKDYADAIVAGASNSFESMALTYYGSSVHTYYSIIAIHLQNAVIRRYGDKACLIDSGCTAAQQEYARSLGYTLLNNLPSGVYAVLIADRSHSAIKTVSDVTTPTAYTPKPVTPTIAQQKTLDVTARAVSRVLELHPQLARLTEFLDFRAFDLSVAPPDTSNIICAPSETNPDRLDLFIATDALDSRPSAPLIGALISGIISSSVAADIFSAEAHSAMSQILGLCALHISKQ